MVDEDSMVNGGNELFIYSELSRDSGLEMSRDSALGENNNTDFNIRFSEFDSCIEYGFDIIDCELRDNQAELENSELSVFKE